MMIIKVIAEGLGLGLLICLYCAIGIRNGAVGLVHLYSNEVQERVLTMGLASKEGIHKRGKLLKVACAFTYFVYVMVCVYSINRARGFAEGFWQIFAILEVANIIDRLVIDEYWVGHSSAWIIPGTEDLRPYISSVDKKKKWIGGTVGFAVIAAIAAEFVSLILG